MSIIFILHQKFKKMNNYFIPSHDAGRDTWLSNFAAKLPTYAAKYGVTDDELTDMKFSTDWFHYWLDYKNKYTEYLKKLTDFKTQIIKGVPMGAVAAIIPTPPVVAAPPKEVPPNVFGRVASLAARIKGYQTYTDADGNDLGIVASQSNVDIINIKPTFTTRLVGGGHPEIVWTKQGMSGIQIYVSRDASGKFEFLAHDSHPNYTDTAPLPAAGSTQAWHYKVIYIYKDEQVGHWSDVASVTVMGN